MRINENGRSMIEMLGVLAIIGVLSVGGIAGYSKAMAKFRSNKTIDQVQHLVTNIRILFGSQKNYEDLGKNDANTYAIITNAALIPDEMRTGSANTMADYTNPYAGKIEIKYAQRFSDESGSANKAFIIRYFGIPQSACVDLASQDWNSSAGTGLIAFGVNDGSAIDAKYLDNCSDTKATAIGGPAVTCVQNMPMKVGQASTTCKKGSANTLGWKFY